MRKPLSSAAIYEAAEEAANEAVSAFSLLHRDIRMNVGQWEDLREAIRLEIIGHFDPNIKDINFGAGRLLKTEDGT